MSPNRTRKLFRRIKEIDNHLEIQAGSSWISPIPYNYCKNTRDGSLNAERLTGWASETPVRGRVQQMVRTTHRQTRSRVDLIRDTVEAMKKKDKTGESLRTKDTRPPWTRCK